MARVEFKYIGYLTNKLTKKKHKFKIADTCADVFHAFNSMVQKDEFNLSVEKHSTIIEQHYPYY